MLYLTNALSLSMLPGPEGRLICCKLSPVEARVLLVVRPGWISGVGHADTAAIFSKILEIPVEHRRVSLSLGPGDEILAGQYTGPRLPEGTTELPDGATITWWYVSIYWISPATRSAYVPGKDG